MRRILCPLLFLLASALSLTAQSRHDVTMTVDGVERHFIVVRPSGAPPANGYPLVFMFHGTSGDGERFFNISGWKEVGEQETIVTVYPSSLEYCVNDDGVIKRTTKWNNGDLQENACPGQEFKNDVTFVRRMLDTIERTIPIDPRRRFVCGFSNGGIFASKLAIEMSDVFAAAAAAAGPLHPLDSATPVRHIPVLFTVGTLDDRATGRLGIAALPFNDSALTYVRSTLDRFRGALGLDDEYRSSTAPYTLLYRWSTSMPGVSAASFTFGLIDSLDHQFPNGLNHPVNEASAVWQFFRAATATSAAPLEALPDRLDLTMRSE
jgi:polyhydroxybutyrate depolymerase